jgi:hypothetical protein
MTTTCTIEAAPFIPEPQHGAENLEGVHEHGQEWITCKRCGRQWSVNGCDAEVVTEGDGYCDENPDGES